MDNRLLHSFYSQWNGYQSKEFVKTCDCFQNFWLFYSFSEFNDHYWPTNVFKSCRWVTWPNARDKECFEQFLHCKIWTFFYCILQCFASFLNIVFFLFDLFTNKARKLKVTQSNQAKASLTKPWLATDEANRQLFESVSPDVNRLCLFVRSNSLNWFEVCPCTRSETWDWLQKLPRECEIWPMMS